MNFLDNLEVLLKNNNLSKNEFAKKIGIAPSTINMWHTRGYENVSLKIIIKIAKFFSVTLDELIFGSIEVKEEKVIYFSSKQYNEFEMSAIRDFSELINEVKKAAKENA